MRSVRVDSLDLPPFTVGVLSLSAQAILLREVLARGMGNEIVLTLVLALWLLGSALGSLIWRHLLRSYERRLRLRLHLAGVVPLAAYLLARFLPLPGAVSGEIPHPAAILILCAVVLLPASFCTAGLFAAAAAGRPPGRAYAAEAAGAICAGTATTTLLVLRLEPLTILACAFALAIALNGRGRMRIPAAAAIILFAAVGGTGRLDDALLARAWQTHHPGLRVVGQAITPSRTLVLVEREGERWLFCDGAPTEMLDDAYGSEQVAATILVAAPRVGSVALVGFGSPGVAAALRRAGVTRVVCLLPEREDTLLAPPAQGVEYVIGDPRRSIARLDGNLDAIVLSGGDVVSLAANRLWTAEAFRGIGRKLSPSGVVVAFMPGGTAATLPASRIWRRRVAQAIRETIGPTAAIDSDRFILSAGSAEGVASWAPDSIAARFARGGFALPTYSARRLALELPAERITELSSASLNRDAQPAALPAALARWIQMSGLDGILVTPVLWALGAALLLAPLAGRRATGALVATGAASMGLDLVILIAYQCRVGMLQGGFGVLFGAFLGGSALGAYLAERRKLWRAHIVPICIGQAVAALAIGTLAPSMPGGPAAVATFAFATLAFIAGLFCGLPFPIVARESGTRRAWAADAIGGIVGALLVLLLASQGLAIVGAALAFLPILASSRLLGSHGRRPNSARPVTY